MRLARNTGVGTIHDISDFIPLCCCFDSFTNKLFITEARYDLLFEVSQAAYLVSAKTCTTMRIAQRQALTLHSLSLTTVGMITIVGQTSKYWTTVRAGLLKVGLHELKNDKREVG